MQREITIMNRGRGPQLSTSRITVQDIVPYIQLNYSYDQIREIMPSLSVAEIEAVERYFNDHREEVLETDRRIRARNAARKNPPEIDELLLPQKLVLLASVGEALVGDDVRCPPLTGVNEATLGVLVKALEQALEFEIDCAQELGDGNHTYWRSLLVAAIRELDGDECDDDLPDPSSCKIDDWNILVRSSTIFCSGTTTGKRPRW